MVIGGLAILPLNKENTKVVGLQFRPQRWSGKITIAGDVIFMPWLTLVVDPGTRIEFEKGADIEGTDWTKWADSFIKDHNDPTGRKGYNKSHYEITGKIIAIGTPKEPIIFTSSQEHPEYADWDELVLLNGSVLDNIELAYAHNGINIQGKNVIVEKSRIHDSLWSCVDIFSGGNIIKDNEIYHCWHQAIGIKKVKGSNIIKNNSIHDSQLSVNCELGATPIIEGNNIKAAPLNQDCGAGLNNSVIEETPDVPGGTYQGQLIYPAF